MKVGLAELKHWSDNATREVIHFPVFIWIFRSYRLMRFCLIQFAGSAWDALKHIRQAVDFLVRVL